MPLSTELTELPDDKVRLDVLVPQAEVAKQTERTLKRLAKDMKIAGFRPGKVPPAVVAQRIGRDAVVEELLRDALGTWYSEAVSEAGVQPVTEPELSLDSVPEDADLSFAATIQLAPKPELGEYRGIEVPREVAEVPDDALSTEIDHLRAQAATLAPAERPAAGGDVVTLDFEGSLGERSLADASARDFVVELGSGRLMPEFEQRVFGMSEGDTASFDVMYPDHDQRAGLAGKTVSYEITVSAVQRKVLPEMTDDLAKEVSEFDTAEELEAAIRTRLDEKAEEATAEMFRRRAIDAAAQNATINVPEDMINARVRSVLEQSQQRMPEGVTLEQYLASRNQTLEGAVEELKPESEKAIMRELVVVAIAEAEGITVSDEELDAQIVEDAERSEHTAEELRAELEKVNGMESLRDDIVLKKAVDVIVETATPIDMETAKARDKLWTPEKEAAETKGGKLWTPGDPKPEEGANT